MDEIRRQREAASDRKAKRLARLNGTAQSDGGASAADGMADAGGDDGSAAAGSMAPPAPGARRRTPPWSPDRAAPPPPADGSGRPGTPPTPVRSTPSTRCSSLRPTGSPYPHSLLRHYHSHTVRTIPHRPHNVLSRFACPRFACSRVVLITRIARRAFLTCFARATPSSFASLVQPSSLLTPPTLSPLLAPLTLALYSSSSLHAFV